MDKTFNHSRLFKIVLRIKWDNYVMNFNAAPIMSRGIRLAIITDEVG